MKQKTIERFKKMVKPYKKTILIVTLMALFIDICELVKPYLLEQVMDKYLPEKLYIYNISKMAFEVDKIHYIYSLCWFPQNVKTNIRYTYNKYK